MVSLRPLQHSPNLQKVYIEQTRCFNERALEHFDLIKDSISGHLAVHCRKCKFQPMLAKKKFWDTQRTGSRQKTETGSGHAKDRNYWRFSYQKAGENCISTPSLSLQENEMAFLEDCNLIRHENWLYLSVGHFWNKRQLEVQHPSCVVCSFHLCLSLFCATSILHHGPTSPSHSVLLLHPSFHPHYFRAWITVKALITDCLTTQQSYN